MNNLTSLQDIARAIRNLIRTGIVTDVDLVEGLCRVQTGGMQTTWLNWLTSRAGRSRVWWAPSVGEQVLILAIGGELDTAFVLPSIFSDDHPAPSASPDALHVAFPDGAVIEYEPESGALTVSGIKTADVTASDSITATVPVVLVKASTRITLDTPEVVCTNKLITATLEVQKGGTMKGNIEHSGGKLTSNGVQVDDHDHGGVKRGDDRTLGVIKKESGDIDQTATKAGAQNGSYIPATSAYGGYQAYQPVTAPAGRSYIDQSKREYNINLPGSVGAGTDLDRQLRDAVDRIDREERARQRSSMRHDG